MSNTQAICNTFKTEVLNGIHAFGATVVRGATTKDSFKIALYKTSATMNKNTTAYGATNEVETSGDYAAGGASVTNANAPSIDTDVAIWTPSANIAWTGVTFSQFDAALLYNSTQSNKAVAVYTFGAQQVTSGDFTLTMPANAAATALLQLA